MIQLVKATIVALLIVATATPSLAQFSTSTQDFVIGDCAAEVIPWTDDEGTSRVEFHWRHLESDGTVKKKLEKIPVGFRPLVVRDLGQGRLAVAGYSETSGNTVVQLWLMNKPRILLAYPTGKAFIDPQGVKRIATIEDTDADNKRDILWISQFRGSDSYLAQYQSGHIWEYSLTGSAPRLVVSPDGEVGTIGLPYSRYHEPRYSRIHADHGAFILVIAIDAQSPDLLLQDANRDGSFDAGRTLTTAERNQMGLDDQTKWVY
ncbi:MAG: hypothetical protein AAFQ53_03245 [Bacteroidota bacterium]